MGTDLTTQFDKELAKLQGTYKAALSADVTRFKAAIAGASESSIIAVGSGGSFTTATLLCNLHEAYTGRVSRASTPLEIISNPTLAASSPVFLISAEGKNPDITEALLRARRHSARTVHVLSNRSTSKLTESLEQLSDVSVYVFRLLEKDGYLATNSLLFNAVIIARAYGELDRSNSLLPPDISELRIGEWTIGDWVLSTQDFVAQVASRGAITVIYAPLLKPVAADLESKLAESALLHCQLADLRSYAHGRHLWLHKRPHDCAILALTEPSLGGLWEAMQAQFPGTVPTQTMSFNGAAPDDLVAGLVGQMHLLSAIAQQLKQDPGRPSVPESGRNLYYIDLKSVIPLPAEASTDVEQAKYDVLGARWPSIRNHGQMRRAKDAYCGSLSKQRFRAVVFDYDGTLCSSQGTDAKPPDAIVAKLELLVRAGVVVGIASGRGGSIQECLQKGFSADVLDGIQLGLYNGGWIGDASKPPMVNDETSEFLSHVTRIIVRLKGLGVPIQDFKTTHPYQVSVRFREGLSTEKMWFVVADALRQAGLDLSRMVRSKHSIDILADGITKSKLVAHIIQSFKIDPNDILTLGDQGAWPGNDSSLLEHRFSLSVDLPSRQIDRGWKLALSHTRDVDATLWYLENFEVTEHSTFSVNVTNTAATLTD